MEKSQKLSARVKLAYGMGALGESAANNIFFSFFLYFITTYAGISPGIAGTISFVAVFWDAITDPIIGHLSDYCKSPKGRRVPFIVFSSIPLGLSVFALFTNPDFSTTGKSIYYLAVNILFWLFYTGADIPYIAFGAEVTTDYDERTSLRTYASVFTGIGAVISIALVIPFVDRLATVAGSESNAWTCFGAIVGVVTAVTFLVTGIGLRKYDRPMVETTHAPKISEMFRDYGDLFKIREYRKIITIAIILNLIIGLGSSFNIYIWKYAFIFSADQIGLVSLICSILAIFSGIPAQWISVKLGRKQSMFTAFVLLVISYTWFFLTPHNFMNALIAQAFKFIGQGMFWAIIYALNYDVVEIDEFTSGKRRDGLLVAVNSFFMKIGISVGISSVGIALELIKLDPTLPTQTPDMASRLMLVAWGLPLILSVIAGLITLTYRVNKKNFSALQEANEKKRNGEEYSTEGFKELI